MVRLLGIAIFVGVLCYLYGPLGIFYAMGLVFLQWVMDGVVAAYAPKTFEQDNKPSDSK